MKFETYASLRIRGAMLDHIRKMDWIPRTVRQRQRRIDEAVKKTPEQWFWFNKRWILEPVHR